MRFHLPPLLEGTPKDLYLQVAPYGWCYELVAFALGTLYPKIFLTEDGWWGQENALAPALSASAWHRADAVRWTESQVFFSVETPSTPERLSSLMDSFSAWQGVNAQFHDDIWGVSIDWDGIFPSFDLYRSWAAILYVALAIRRERGARPPSSTNPGWEHEYPYIRSNRGKIIISENRHKVADRLGLPLSRVLPSEGLSPWMMELEPLDVLSVAFADRCRTRPVHPQDRSTRRPFNPFERYLLGMG